MLALVHPLQHPSAQDNHRPPPRQHTRKHSSSSSASTSVASSSRMPAPTPRPSSTSSTSRHAPPAPAPIIATKPPVTHPDHHRAHTPEAETSIPTPPAETPSPSPSPAPPSTFDIHSYPSGELLRLLASLLTQIASTNDKLASPTSPSHSQQPRIPINDSTTTAPIWRTLTTASRTSLSNPSSALTFHARNIPTISLEAYLLRILKYCPTTNEVFLSLLVYFDRMSKLANEATGRTFVIDSFNVHRLVIAGVTVASKFFSDVFYTNSRYAKVGGLPQPELNQLELQFLLLNDFRLVISTEEMQRYAEQLIVFSESESPLATTHTGIQIPPPPTPPISALPTSGPMQAMGAIDAYGGRMVSDDAYRSSASSSSEPSSSHPQHNNVQNNNKTPSVRPQILGSYAAMPSMPVPVRTNSSTSIASSSAESEAEPDTDTETDAGAETSTEGGWTTDDEPTIRAGSGSRTGSGDQSESDCASLCSVDTEDGDLDEDEGREVEIRGVFEGSETREGEGGKEERTPEQRGKEGDYTMASP